MYLRTLAQPDYLMMKRHLASIQSDPLSASVETVMVVDTVRYRMRLQMEGQKIGILQAVSSDTHQLHEEAKLIVKNSVLCNLLELYLYQFRERSGVE